jgi:hypothetical protein
MSFLRFVNKRDLSIGYISLAHASVHVTDFPVVNVHVDELSSARIKFTNIRQPMLKLKISSGFHDLFLNYNTILMTFWSIVVDKCNIKMYPVYQPTKFGQTIIHQHEHLRRESQSHAPVHVLMRYTQSINRVCLQSERRTSC